MMVITRTPAETVLLSSEVLVYHQKRFSCHRCCCLVNSFHFSFFSTVFFCWELITRVSQKHVGIFSCQIIIGRKKTIKLSQIFSKIRHMEEKTFFGGQNPAFLTVFLEISCKKNSSSHEAHAYMQRPYFSVCLLFLIRESHKKCH